MAIELGQAPEGILPRRNEALTPARKSWVTGFIQGNTFWPQSRDGLNIFFTADVLRDPPSQWSDLLHSQLSPQQFTRNLGTATKRHNEFDVPTDVLGIGRMQELWGDLTSNTITTVANYVNAVTGQQVPTSTPAEDTQRIQTFFDHPANKSHLADLQQIFRTARGALITPDSTMLSNFYKLVITNKPYEHLVPQFEEKYRKIFPQSDRSVSYDPGNTAWEMAAYNVHEALQRELPERDFSWLGRTLDMPTKVAV